MNFYDIEFVKGFIRMCVVNGQVAVAGKGIRIGGVELLQFLPPFCMGEGAQS